ncbi:hypothetical protein NHP20013_01240 [Helicobacter bizzozeronii]|nr:hypothetical protein NHP20013_01240 [Helicobacter bizzozeronii]
MWWQVVLLGAFLVGCKNDVFTLPYLNFTYKSAPVKDKPDLGNLVVAPAQVAFSREFLPKYYQKRYAKGLQEGIAKVLGNRGYQVILPTKKNPNKDPNALQATIAGTIHFAFQNTPSDLKAIKAMLKATHNDYLEPARVLRMLEIQAHFKVCEGPICQIIAQTIYAPILKANPIDSDPNERGGPNQSYNNAIIEGLNRLYQKSLKDLENQLQNQLQPVRTNDVI